jgi:hypothetical protein
MSGERREQGVDSPIHGPAAPAPVTGARARCIAMHEVGQIGHEHVVRPEKLGHE